MSSYIDALKSARPEHLYVLDLDRTALTAGTVTDDGYNPVNGTVNETGTVGIEPVEPLIEGLTRSLKFNVVHDRQLNDANEGFGRIDTFDSDNYFGPDSSNFFIEMVVHVPGYNRARSGWEASIGSPLLHWFASAQHCGFSNYRVDKDNFRFILRIRSSVQNQDLFATSSTFPSNATYHVGLQRVGDSFTLYVNGKRIATELKTVDFDVNPDTMRIGGFVSVRHSDSTIQSVAFFDRNVNTEEVKARYDMLTFNSEYEGTVEALRPDLAIYNEDDGSVGTLEPYMKGISEGADSRDLYEDENETLSIQPTELAAAVTKSKKLVFDLSGLTAGISTYLDIESVTDANSSLTVNYSFDDAAYSVWTEGEDNIPELDANWGGVI